MSRQDKRRESFFEAKNIFVFVPTSFFLFGQKILHFVSFFSFVI